MKKLLLVLALLLVTNLLHATDPPATYYYTLQHYSMTPSTNITTSSGKVDNVMRFRGNYELMNDTFTVSLSDMTPKVIIYSTGGIYVNGEITASSISGVVIDTLTVNSVGANQLQSMTMPDDVICSSAGVSIIGKQQVQSDADISIYDLTLTYGVNASTGVYTSSVTVGAYTLPTNDGSANEILETNGSGVLSWTSAGAGDVVLASTQTHTGIKSFNRGLIVSSNTAYPPANGMIMYNSGDKKMWAYTDDSWSQIDSAGGSGSSNQYFGADLPCNAYVTNGIAYWKQPNYAISITTITIDYTSDGTDSVFEDGYDVKVDSNTGTFYTIMTSSTTLQITDDDNVSATTGSFKQVSYPAGTVWRFDILTVGSTEGGDPITILIEWTED